jgi:hypothetical protein
VATATRTKINISNQQRTQIKVNTVKNRAITLLKDAERLSNKQLVSVLTFTLMGKTLNLMTLASF